MDNLQFTTPAPQELLSPFARTGGELQQELAQAFSDHQHLAPEGMTFPFMMGEAERSRVTLENMPRWVEIYFPRSLAAELGRDGIAISTSRLFGWVAGDVMTNRDRAEYYRKLAGALASDGATAPCVESLYDDLLGRLAEVVQFRSWISTHQLEVTPEAVEHLNWYANIVLSDIIDAGGYPNLEVGLPEDVLPPWVDCAKNGHGMSIPVGLVLTYLIDEIEEDDPVLSASLRRAIDAYYPDEKVEIEVITPDGDNFDLVPCCADPSRNIHRATGALECVPGSIDLKNYGGESRYSPENDRYPYRIFRCWDDEDEEMCLLMSEHLVLQASVHRDEE